MSLDGTQTHENLKAAFAGESQANRRYLYFAKVADIEGSTFPAKELDSHYLFVARDLPLPDRHDDGSHLGADSLAPGIHHVDVADYEAAAVDLQTPAPSQVRACRQCPVSLYSTLRTLSSIRSKHPITPRRF